MAKYWTREEAWYGVIIVRLPPAFLIRHGWRRATFPSGEGIRCVALVGAVGHVLASKNTALRAERREFIFFLFSP